MVCVFPLPRSNSVGSFPVWVELSLGRISTGAHYLPQDEISDLEVPVFNSGIVVLSHEVLILCQSLFYDSPDFV